MRGKQPRIGYLLNAFPVVSETFILNELRLMAAHRVPIAILSLAPPRGRLAHASVREVRGPRLVAPPAGLRGLPVIAASHFALALRSPRRYAAAGWKVVGTELVAAAVRPRPGGFRRLGKRLRRFALAGWAAAAARRLGIRHVHAHYAKEPLEVAEIVRRLAGLPYSFAAHAKDLYTSPPERLSRRLRRAEFAVACHRDGERRLRELAAPGHEAKVLLIPHGLDTRLFRPCERQRREPGRILAVGRLTPKKGFDDLVRACAILRDEGHRFRCDIIGQGREERALRRLIEELALEARVRLARFVRQEDLPREYARASVVALPSRVTADGNRDGVPNVLLEAMACGAPVVAARAGAIPEAVRDGETAVLVPPADPRALARALASLLRDPERAERIGRAAAARTARLDFRRAMAPLAERFLALCPPREERAAERVERAAWAPGGIAERAAGRLGRRPRRRPAIERAIRAAVMPGLRANAWRGDLARMGRRRLWDELDKAATAEQVRRLLKPGCRREERLLDLGCGRGGLAVALRAAGIPVVAVDLRRRNCSVTRWRGRRYDLEIDAVVARAERLPFPDGAFRFACCLEVLEHVSDPARLLQEIRRVLVPGGACALTVINRWAHFDPHYRLWGINFLPRSIARRYVAWRGRTKRSYRDLQALDEMHYFRWGRFVRLARECGLRVEDPRLRGGLGGPIALRLCRATSLGFNSALVIVRAEPDERTPATQSSLAR